MDCFDHDRWLIHYKNYWPMDESPLDNAHNAQLDALETGILAELEQNIAELAKVEVTMIESWIDMVWL